MSTHYDPPPEHRGPQPVSVVPVHMPPPPRRSPAGWIGCFFLFLILGGSLVLNLFLIIILSMDFGDLTSSGVHLHERYYSGSRTATDKIAIVRIDGVLMDGAINFAQQQIEQAETDKSVKAVVVRIDSPGGSITASDDLYHRLMELRDGNPAKKAAAKPMVVSMGGVAASGGYYIAMPSKTLMAEPTTITGSIGVYAALPNVTELGNKVGFKMNVIKAGEVKDSGSPFKEMSEKEKQVWQQMVDQAYLRFLHVVEGGRPQLKGKLQEDITINTDLPIRVQEKRPSKLTRYRADGGIFVAEEAKRFGLIDDIGYLDDAIDLVVKQAGLGPSYHVMEYQRPPLSLFRLFLGETRESEPKFDPSHLSQAATPRLWYLGPQSELAGLLKAAACP
jgi:protease IV